MLFFPKKGAKINLYISFASIKVKQRLEKKKNIVKIFKNSTNNIIEEVSSFPIQKAPARKKVRKHSKLYTISTTVDTFVNHAVTSTSVTLSVTRFRLVITAITTGTASDLGLANKVLYKIYQDKYSERQKLLKSLTNDQFFWSFFFEKKLRRPSKWYKRLSILIWNIKKI